ncbi:MAG: hypothetical protein VW600_04880 [Ferrovibrio sp.]
MKRLDRYKKEVQVLVLEGTKILGTASSSRNNLQGDDLAKLTAWLSRVGHIILELCGENSQYYRNYSAALATNAFYTVNSGYYGHIARVHGILFALSYDVENGLVEGLRDLLQAEIFGDFLEMAEYLLNEGYKDPAAVIAGAVLEDTLRKICTRCEIPVENESGKSLTIDPLNTALLKKEIYDKLIHKQITSWADLRNNAAHGKFSSYDKDQVKLMILFVQKFASDYLEAP